MKTFLSRRPRISLRSLLVAAVLALPLAGSAQGAREVQVRGPFQVPIYDRQNRRVALLTGQGVKAMGNQIPMETVRLDYFDELGGTNLTILGTNCLYDLKAQQAYSPGGLRILTGDGRLEIVGRGFHWWQTNNDLVISNDVRTLVVRPPSTARPASRAPLAVTSETMLLRYQSNQVTYRGQVRVTDETMDLTCEELVIQRGTVKELEWIAATGGVVIDVKLMGSRAFCDEARYSDSDGHEVVELTGHPRWQDGPREGSAEVVRLDNTARTLVAIGNARFKLPRQTASGSGLFQFGLPASTSAPADPKAFVEVQASRMTLQLPATNGPVQQVVAETNVVILDLEGRGAARSQRAVYTEPGQVELSGDPSWSGEGRELRASLMSFDALRQTFAARTNAVMRLPLAALGDRFPGLRTSDEATNRQVEIHSDFVAFADGILSFGQQVRVDYLDGTQRLGELVCRSLEVPYSNRVQALWARGGVVATQFPVPSTNGVERTRVFRSESAHLEFNAAGELAAARAETDVTVDQRTVKPGPVPPVLEQLKADRVEALFGASNRVDRGQAVGNVLVAQGQRQATAGRADYDGGTGLMKLTENPIATMPEGRITQAEALAWDTRTGRYRVLGRYKVDWKRLPDGGKLPGLPQLKGD
ncbi:MAG: LptA/OstA family protein [Limisphaerales bacterium]